MNREEIIVQLKEAQQIINQCVAALGARNSASITAPKNVPAAVSRPIEIDFTLNERNFVKTYSKGMNGQKKFVLLLAYLAKGKTGIEVEKSIIASRWAKMTAKELLGTYNDKYPTAAKTSGWVDSKKQGTYHLRDSWMGIVS